MGIYTQKNRAGQARWYVRMVVEGRRQRFAPRGGFVSAREATTFWQNAQVDIRRATFFPSEYHRAAAIALSTVVQTYLQTVTTSKNAITYGAWWITEYGTRDIRSLNPALLEDAQRRLGHKSIATQHHYLKFLRHLCNRLVRDGQLNTSPFAQFRLRAPLVLREHYYSEEERHQLYAALGLWGSAAEFAVLTGLRWAEQFLLQPGAINLNQGFVTLASTKAGVPQIRHLNPRAVAIVTAWMAQSNEYVFSTDPSDPMSYDAFRRRIWRPGLAKAGLTGRWHDLRHTFASDLTIQGNSDRTVATLLGHRSTQMVQRYAHLSATHLHAAVAKLPTQNGHNLAILDADKMTKS